MGLIDGAAQDPPVGADRLIRLAEMLAGAVLYGPHRLAGPLVIDVDVSTHSGEGLVLLLVRIEAVVVALVLARDVVGQLVKLEALAAHLGQSDKAISAYRRILRHAIEEAGNGGKLPMVLDATAAAAITGPAAIDGIASGEPWQSYWQKTDQSRRKASSWANEHS